ncbi:hypothetical protein HanHA300_Chr16g0606051 [Helianthus annuus]|nr:hypothetical protein HanHA300_Chr16g0606051 [Helianthus annuus]KAJ0460095.1 hypothetical protein HanHA89_Chr16g0656611 [Helianthus annuus]KAJ0640538.1 hypothetical protein HanLR1_Chr16g0616631 [Helianthus annuus]
MSRLCPTKYVGVLSRDILIKLNWVTILNASALHILLNSITTLLNTPNTPTHPKIYPVCDKRARIPFILIKIK